MWPYTIQNIFLYSIKKYLFLMTDYQKREKEKTKANNNKKQTETYRLNTSNKTSNKHLTKHKEK